MESTSFWLIYVLAGAIGAGYLVYGWKQKKVIPLIAGIGLNVYPYFIGNIYLLIGIGIVLILLPFLIKD